MLSLLHCGVEHLTKQIKNQSNYLIRNLDSFNVLNLLKFLKRTIKNIQTKMLEQKERVDFRPALFA